MPAVTKDERKAIRLHVRIHALTLSRSSSAVDRRKAATRRDMSLVIHLTRLNTMI